LGAWAAKFDRHMQLVRPRPIATGCLTQAARSQANHSFNHNSLRSRSAAAGIKADDLLIDDSCFLSGDHQPHLRRPNNLCTSLPFHPAGFRRPTNTSIHIHVSEPVVEDLSAVLRLCSCACQNLYELDERCLSYAWGRDIGIVAAGRRQREKISNERVSSMTRNGLQIHGRPLCPQDPATRTFYCWDTKRLRMH
jgi:hypothetical protein